MADSLVAYGPDGEPKIIVHFDPNDGEPNYQAHIVAHQQAFPGGVTVRVTPELRKQIPEPINVDGKAHFHGMNKLLQADVARADANVGDALQAKIDTTSAKLAAMIKAEADYQAKLQSFKDSLTQDQKGKFDTLASKQGLADLAKTLTAEQKSLAPFDADAVAAAP